MSKKKTKRHELKFNPQYEGAIAGWVYNHLKKNYWRVASHHDFEDLLQDAYVKFLHCRSQYIVSTPSHFMALFKRAYTNHIHDLSVQCSTECDLTDIHCREDTFEYNEVLEGIVGDLTNEGEMMAKFKDVPPEVLEVMKILVDDMREIDYTLRRTEMPYLFKRETLNQFLCRLIGADPKKISIVEHLRSILEVT